MTIAWPVRVPSLEEVNVPDEEPEEPEDVPEVEVVVGAGTRIVEEPIV